MNKGIRFVIIVVLAFTITALGDKYFGPFDADASAIITLLLCVFGGGWLDRNVLQRFLPD